MTPTQERRSNKGAAWGEATRVLGMLDPRFVGGRQATTSGIVLEGVTGAGKTQTLRALAAHPAFAALVRCGRVFPEEDTLGPFLAEFSNPQRGADGRDAQLRRVVAGLRRSSSVARDRYGAGYGYVLERLHPSAYALMPDRDRYDPFDHVLDALNAKVVLLGIADDEIERRALTRVERRHTRGATRVAELTDAFGSRERVAEAIAAAQARRRAYATLSRLPFLEIDTTAMAWDAYADQIVRFWAGDSEAAR